MLYGAEFGLTMSYDGSVSYTCCYVASTPALSRQPGRVSTSTTTTHPSSRVDVQTRAGVVLNMSRYRRVVQLAAGITSGNRACRMQDVGVSESVSAS